MARLKRLVIHCTDTPEGHEVTSDDIRHWHCDPKPKGNGWKQVGYTDMIHLDGSIERLVRNNEDENVDPWEVTNGAAGFNSTSRHIVYVGGRTKDRKRTKDTRTAKQREAMAKYVKDFHRKHPAILIVGHRDLPGVSKDCPCFDVASWLREIGIK